MITTKPIKLKINGTLYNSISEASRSIGISQSKMSRIYKKISASRLTEHEVKIRVEKTFTIIKIKDK